MHSLVFLASASLLGVVLALVVTVVLAARIHLARMKKLDRHYSPVPEFALDNYYAVSDSPRAPVDVHQRLGRNREEAYARLPKAAGL
jgi:hypothetical protein